MIHGESFSYKAVSVNLGAGVQKWHAHWRHNERPWQVVVNERDWPALFDSKWEAEAAAKQVAMDTPADTLGVAIRLHAEGRLK